MTGKRKDLAEQADVLLAKSGFLSDGRPKKSLSKGQRFFEKRIIKTPMGNGSR